MGFIHKLYHLEHQLPPPDTPEHIAARHATRQAQAIPILNDLKAWLDATLGTALPKSAVAAAIRYVTNHWAAFVRYTEDGRLSLDNNLSERTLRLIAVGRSNWKFVGSAKAGVVVRCDLLFASASKTGRSAQTRSHRSA